MGAPTSALTRTGRACALTLLALGLVHLAQVPAHIGQTAYLALLSGAAAVGFLGAATRMWFGRHFDGSLLGGSLCVLAFVAQVVVLVLGLPGVPEQQAGPTPSGVLAMGLEVATLVLLWRDRRPIGRG